MLSPKVARVVFLHDSIEVPATFYAIANQEDVAGEVHKWLANGLIPLVAIHTSAALKHHFIDHDATLRRMLGLGGTAPTSAPANQTRE